MGNRFNSCVIGEQWRYKRLEQCAGKLASTVLRRGGGRKAAFLSDAKAGGE